MDRLPNFIYIGTSKAGSTWLFNVLTHHDDVYISPGKGHYFFDHHFDREVDWYRMQFRMSSNCQVVGELSHSYMYSESACSRIADTIPDVKLMVCLREPADHAFSAYLDGKKNGQIHGSFGEALKSQAELIDHGMYAKHLTPYVERFGRERIHVAVFDNLVASPNNFAKEVFEFLGVSDMELPARLCKKVMPAGTPRAAWLRAVAKKGSQTAKAMGLRKTRGWIKRSRIVRSIFYRPYRPDEKPKMDDRTREHLRGVFQDDVAQLDELFGMDLQRLWGYSLESTTESNLVGMS